MSVQGLPCIMLISDLDGTLLNSRSEVSPSNLSAIRHFTRKGGLFTIATGRSEISVRRYMSSLPLNAPAILYNGAMIYDFHAGRVLWSTVLPREVAVTVGLLPSVFPGLGVEIYQGGTIYCLSENSITSRHLAREHLGGIGASSPEAIPQPWQKVLLAWEPERLALVESFLKDQPLTRNFVRSESCFLEILPGDISKGSALCLLMGELGLSRYQVVAMGDNLNDIEMLCAAGWGIAVANAHADLKARASFCCGHHDREAVDEIINWIDCCLTNELLSV